MEVDWAYYGRVGRLVWKDGGEGICDKMTNGELVIRIGVGGQVPGVKP